MLSEFILSHLLIVGKTVLLYFVLILVMRIMGKREIGQLSLFDVVVFFVISELLSLSINDDEAPLTHALIPIGVIVGLEILTSFIVLKFKKMRTIVEGEPTYIIYRGVIDQYQMRKNRYNIDDLLGELRRKDVYSPAEVEYAILEASGRLNIIKRKDNNLLYPDPLISDRVIDYNALKRMKLTKEWLIEQLNKMGHKSEESVFLCLYQTDGLYIVAINPERF